jgi:RNA polymerase sigma-70 factor, ECF subfamily
MRRLGVTLSTDRYEAFYREQGARLWRALRAFSGDPEIASDALGEAFAQAIGRGDEVRDPGAWIWRVSFVLARAELSRRPHVPLGSTDQPYLPSDHILEVVEALRAIGEKQRLAIVLHDYADRPTEEIAKVLGCTRATVHVHLSAGRRRLRALLEEEDDE